MIRGPRDSETVARRLLAAAGPVALLWLRGEGRAGAWRRASFLLVAGIRHLIFMLARAQPPSVAGALAALAIAILAPQGPGPLHRVLAAAFGVVMADPACGGRGRNVPNPAVVTPGFIGFGFPAAPRPEGAWRLAGPPFPPR